MSVIDINKGLGISDEADQQINTDEFNKFAGSIILLQRAVTEIDNELSIIQKAINTLDKNLEGVNKNVTAVINNNVEAIKSDLKDNRIMVADEFQKLTIAVNALPVNIRNQVCVDLDKSILALSRVKKSNDQNYEALMKILDEYKNLPKVFDEENNKLNEILKKFLVEQNNAIKAQSEEIRSAADKYSKVGTQLGVYLVIAVVFICFVYFNDKFIPQESVFSGAVSMYLAVLFVVVACTFYYRE